MAPVEPQFERKFEHFVAAQDPIWSRVTAELLAGRKTSHWMWFVFPQLRALGRSPTARAYGLDSLDDARTYVAHPVLGARLREAARLMLQIRGRTAFEVLGTPDDLKLRSCMTLFAAALPAEQVFLDVLARYYDGQGDDRTLELLGV